jgi:hypothetical protein
VRAVRRRPGLLAGAAALALASGCSSPAELSATLTTPTDVTLSWTGTTSGAAGRVVEFATAADGEYTILAFRPATASTYKHPDLIPETTFYYRVRPYFGPASNEVEVALPAGDFGEKEAAADHSWARPQRLPGPVVARGAIRGDAVAAAVPTGLTAKVMSANGLRFTWTDHASDEEGYLLEARPRGAADFTPIEMLDPDMNSVGIVTLPTEKDAAYRVRAFYFGASSNVVRETTGSG